MRILRVTYLERGYFKVKYNSVTVIQDLEAIKMTCPMDKSLNPIILFLRKLKLESLQENNNDEEYRDTIIFNILKSGETLSVQTTTSMSQQKQINQRFNIT